MDLNNPLGSPELESGALDNTTRVNQARVANTITGGVIGAIVGLPVTVLGASVLSPHVIEYLFNNPLKETWPLLLLGIVGGTLTGALMGRDMPVEVSQENVN